MDLKLEKWIHLISWNHVSCQLSSSHKLLLQKSIILEAETIVFVLTIIIHSINWLTSSTRPNCRHFKKLFLYSCFPLHLLVIFVTAPSLHCLEGNSLECSIRLSANQHPLCSDLHPSLPDGVHSPFF